MKTRNMTTRHLKKSISRSPLRLGFLLIPLVLGWFALSPTARAVSPAPDGGYSGNNTAEGTNALFSLTTGIDNTANGFYALYHNTTGIKNTATGFEALYSNTTGSSNTATGQGALYSNTTINGVSGINNTADGVNALYHNTTGRNNTANGLNALNRNATGIENTANGAGALYFNTSGIGNTASGFQALEKNTIGGANTAVGVFALFSNTTGNNNTANGLNALVSNTIGSSNIALGVSAGQSLTTGSNNIDIDNVGSAGEANTIRIGTEGTQTATFIAGISGETVTGTAVVVSSNGRLGVAPSSARFKDEIKPMDKASEAILALKPVTFRYKHELDPEGTPQFGLVAEEVEKVNPDLVARDADGKVYTVRYEAVNAMLLNEFLKEHRRVQELKSIAAKQEATAAQQQQDFQAAIAQQRKDFQATAAEQGKEIKTLTASLKEHASQIQKVNQRLDQTPLLPLQVDNSK
jgi:hypothetical protein